jgi:hypothetical protein
MTQITTQARRSRRGEVETEQRIRIASPVVDQSVEGARALARAYWAEVERSTGRLIRASAQPAGVELRLWPFGPTFLAFGQPELTVQADVVECRFAITGGLLARRPAGALTLAQRTTPDVEIDSTVSGFLPRLDAPRGFPGWTGALYPVVQARVHDAIGRRFLRRLAREAGA